MRPDSSASVGGKSESKLTNQFNFSERASQTYNNPYRVSYLHVYCGSILSLVQFLFSFVYVYGNLC